MKEFKVLPTDPRYQDLTQDQLLFIFTQMRLENERQNGATGKNHPGYDPEYDKDDPDGNLDYYEDPDFDKAWESDDESSESEEWEEV